MTEREWGIVKSVKSQHLDYFKDLEKKYNAGEMWNDLDAQQREVFKTYIPCMIIGAANEINATATVLRRPQPCTAGEIYWRIKNFCESAGVAFNEQSIKAALGLK